MDQLNAYRILGIPQGSSPQEIKEAYAALSKRYHPEEHPEEFQQIHEAYSVLMKKNRRRKPERQTPQTNLFGEPEERNQEAEREPRRPERQGEPSWDFYDVPQQTEKQDGIPETSSEPSWDFESALHRAERQEQADIHEVTLRALSEMKILLTPGYMHKLKLFRAFFKKPEYQEALKGPEFMAGFAALLQDTYLKKRIYDYFIDYYRLRGASYSELIPEARRLYDVLQKKRGMQAKNKENTAYIIPAAILPAARVVVRDFDSLKAGAPGIIGIIILVIAGIWLYRKLYENHSGIFSQVMLALLVMLIQIVVMFSGLGGWLFGDIEAGDVIAVLLFMLAGIWLIGLGIAKIILMIRNRVRKK